MATLSRRSVRTILLHQESLTFISARSSADIFFLVRELALDRAPVPLGLVEDAGVVAVASVDAPAISNLDAL